MLFTSPSTLTPLSPPATLSHRGKPFYLAPAASIPQQKTCQKSQASADHRRSLRVLGPLPHQSQVVQWSGFVFSLKSLTKTSL